MKKITALLLALVIALSLASCSVSIEKDTGTSTETERTPDTKKAPETTKAPDTTESPDTTNAPETTEEPETTKEPETDLPDIDDDFDPEDYLDRLVDAYDYYGLSIPIPAGFTQKANGDMVMLVPEDYPAHTDNITLIVGNDNYDAITADAMKSALESAGDVSDFQFTKDTINFTDGTSLPYIEMFYTYKINNVEMFQINFTVYYEDRSVTAVYTMVSEDYFELLEASYYFIGFYD